MKTPFTEAENIYLAKTPGRISVKKFRELFPNCVEKLDKAVSSRRNTLRNAKRRRETVRTYSEHFLKREIYMMVASWCGITSNVVTLLGPNGQGHADFLIDKILGARNFIISYEFDKDIYDKQASLFQTYDNVYLHNMDAIHASAANYMDIDLMRTYSKEKDIIKTLFNRQSQLKGAKLFSTTFSVNWLCEAKTIETINDCLNDLGINAHVTSYKDVWLNKKSKYKQYFISLSYGYEIVVFKYHDTSNMISINILQK